MAEIRKHVLIALGSNLGDTEKNLRVAIDQIREHIGDIESISRFYASKAEGFDSEFTFSNACLICQTTLTPHALLSELKKIEFAMGRTKSKESYEDRIIDLDIIFYGNEQLQTPDLTIPHPRFKERSFVMDPLREIVNQVYPFWSLSIV